MGVRIAFILFCENTKYASVSIKSFYNSVKHSLTLPRTEGRVYIRNVNIPDWLCAANASALVLEP